MSKDIFSAISDKDLELCKEMVSQKPKLLLSPPKKDISPLAFAALFGSVDIMRHFIEAGANTDVRDKRGFILLKAALRDFDSYPSIHSEQFGIFKYLLTVPRVKADSSVIDEFIVYERLHDIKRILDAAVSAGRSVTEFIDGNVISYLQQHPENHSGAVLKEYMKDHPLFENDKSESFHAVFTSYDSSYVNKINKYQGDINVRDNVGRTPLLIAAAHISETEVFDAFKKRGADFNAVDNYGGDGLFYALAYCIEHKEDRFRDILKSFQPVSPAGIMLKETYLRGGPAFSFRCGECRNPIIINNMSSFVKKRNSPDKVFIFTCPHCQTLVNFSKIIPAADIDEQLRAYTAKNGGLPVLPRGDSMPKAIDRDDVGAVKAILAKSKKYAQQKDKWGIKPLVNAVGNNSIEITEALLDAGVKPKWNSSSILTYPLGKISGSFYHAEKGPKNVDWAMFDFLLARKEVFLDENIIIQNLESKFPENFDAALTKIKASGKPLDALTSKKVIKAALKRPEAKGTAVYKKHFPF